MKYLNRILLKGRTGTTPELRSMPSGAFVCHFQLATRTGAGEGEHVEWHSIVCYDKLAELAAKEIDKGDGVYVEGRIQTRTFQTEEGRIKGHKERKVVEIVASEFSVVVKRHPAENAPEVKESPNGRAVPAAHHVKGVPSYV